jgi:hypothetical protein
MEKQVLYHFRPSEVGRHTVQIMLDKTQTQDLVYGLINSLLKSETIIRLEMKGAVDITLLDLNSGEVEHLEL